MSGDISLISDGICSTMSNSYGSMGNNLSISYRLSLSIGVATCQTSYIKLVIPSVLVGSFMWCRSK